MLKLRRESLLTAKMAEAADEGPLIEPSLAVQQVTTQAIMVTLRRVQQEMAPIISTPAMGRE